MPKPVRLFPLISYYWEPSIGFRWKAKVNDFLKKSCMEFCGSLPGDEKDEDGYSLSGEAKDATASRNGMSRNQMGIEEKAAECKEAATVLANGNAL